MTKLQKETRITFQSHKNISHYLVDAEFLASMLSDLRYDMQVMIALINRLEAVFEKEIDMDMENDNTIPELILNLAIFSDKYALHFSRIALLTDLETIIFTPPTDTCEGT